MLRQISSLHTFNSLYAMCLASRTEALKKKKKINTVDMIGHNTVHDIKHPPQWDVIQYKICQKQMLCKWKVCLKNDSAGVTKELVQIQTSLLF